jgi:hypothetical protein
MVKEIHISDVRAYKSCRQKWLWSSRTEGNWEPDMSSIPLLMGRGVHYALEQLYTVGTPPVTALNDFYAQEEKTTLQDVWLAEIGAVSESSRMAENMLAHYDMWRKHKSNLYDGNLEFITMEVPFDLPLVRGRIKFAGRFDGIVRHKPTDTHWLWELKTSSQPDQLQKSLANDEQASAYIWAARQLYPKSRIQGIIYTIMRKKSPIIPARLKSGLLSQAASMDTTYDWYMKCIHNTHPDWDQELIDENYGAFLEKLRYEDNTYFMRFQVQRTPTQIANFVRDLKIVCREMASIKTPIYPAPGSMNCNFCSFVQPCLALFSGHDPDLYLKSNFHKRPADPATASLAGEGGVLL